MELHVSRFKEVSLDGDIPLNSTLINSPFGHPLSCIEIGQLHILPRNTDIDIQRFLRQIHKDYIQFKIPWVPKGSL